MFLFWYNDKKQKKEEKKPTNRGSQPGTSSLYTFSSFNGKICKRSHL